jgi:predicted lactoylglutathione lyase
LRQAIVQPCGPNGDTKIESAGPRYGRSMTDPTGEEERLPLRANAIVPFVPARDYEVSTAFYRALGFSVPDDQGQRYCELDGCAFLLQDYYVKVWADNCMLNVFVDDAQAWIDRAATVASEYTGVRTKPLERQDWGPLLGHIWDPSGVLWNVLQLPAD